MAAKKTAVSVMKRGKVIEATLDSKLNPSPAERSLAVAERPVAPLALGGLVKWNEVKVIKLDDEFQNAAEALKHVKGLQATIEAERVSLTKPLNDVIKKLNGNAKTCAGPLVDLELHIKDLLISFEERRRMAALKEAEKVAAKVEQSSPQAALEIRTVAKTALVTPDVGGLSFRKLKRARVNDMMTLIKAVAEGRASIECLEVNQRYIDAIAKVSTGDSSIPGVSFVEETIAASGKVG